MLGCGGGEGRCEKCGGCGEVLGKVWESVLGCRERKERDEGV